MCCTFPIAGLQIDVCAQLDKHFDVGVFAMKRGNIYGRLSDFIDCIRVLATFHDALPETRYVTGRGTLQNTT
jgi:hypothetical protein